MEKEENGDLKDDLNWEVFLDRKRLKKSEAARLIGAAPAMMTDWVNRETYPSHKYLKKLCLIGMTAQEMFGKEAGDALIKNSTLGDIKEPSGPKEPIDYKDPIFLQTVQNAMAYIEECKRRGIK